MYRRIRNGDSKHPFQEGEIPPVGGHDGGPMAAGGQCDQGVVLEVPSLGPVPSLRITDGLNELPCVPPISGCRLPLDHGDTEEGVHEPPGRRGAGSPAKLGEHHR